MRALALRRNDAGWRHDAPFDFSRKRGMIVPRLAGKLKVADISSVLVHAADAARTHGEPGVGE